MCQAALIIAKEVRIMVIVYQAREILALHVQAMYAITTKIIPLGQLIRFADPTIASASVAWHVHAHQIPAMMFLLIAMLLLQQPHLQLQLQPLQPPQPPPPLLPPQPQQHQQPQQQPQQFYAKTNAQA